MYIREVSGVSRRSGVTESGSATQKYARSLGSLHNKVSLHLTRALSEHSQGRWLGEKDSGDVDVVEEA